MFKYDNDCIIVEFFVVYIFYGSLKRSALLGKRKQTIQGLSAKLYINQIKV